MQLALAAAGSYIGGMMAGGAGVVAFGMTGAQLGFMAGSMLGGVLFQPKLPDGPRMNDLSIQTSTYGASIPRVWGSARMAGNVIWTTDLVEHAHEQSAGGKGGGSTYTTYTYTVSFAVSLCEGPISGVRRIWADGKLIYDVSEGSTNQIGFSASGYACYLGSEDQDVDPTIQAHMTNTPAYRGQAYWVFSDLDLTKYGNRIPNLTFEVVTSASSEPLPPTYFGPGGKTIVYSERVWSVTGTNLYVYIEATGELVTTVALLDVSESITVGDNKIWVGYNRSPYTGPGASAIDPATYQILFSTNFGSGSAVTRYAHVTWNASLNILYGCINEGISQGIKIYPSNTVSGISVPAWVWVSLEMPDIARIAFAGWGNWLVIADAQNDVTLATITNPAWSSTAQFSRLMYDKARHCIYWGMVEDDNVYKVDLSTYALTLLIPITGGTSGPQFFFYSDRTDSIYLEWQADVRQYSAATGELLNTFPGIAHSSGGYGNTVGATAGFFASEFISPPGSLWKYDLGFSLDPGVIPLSQIVTDLSLACGLAANDINVTELTDQVRGFMLGHQGSARSALEYLMMAYLFDAVESEGKIKFVKRGAAAVLTIAADDLAVHEQGQDVPASLEMTRADEIELPRNVTLKYINFEADYQTSAQNAMRQSGRALGELTMDIPVVMIDTHAKAVADYALYSAWAARTTAKWATSLKFAKAEPTDVVRVADNLMRITKRSLQGNILSFEGAMESGIVVATAALAGEAQSVTQTIVVYGETLLMLLDLAMLRDEDDDAGFYLAASGFIEAWPGCVMLKSTDNGASYNQMQTLVTPAVIGTAGGVLGDFQDNTFDEFNTVEVTLYSGELASTTELLVLNGGNAAVLGNEVIQFKNATLVSGTTYVLSGLLRARKGSPTGGHVAGERFVLLNSASLRRAPPNAAEIGLARIYRAITLGATFSSGTDVAFTNTAQGLECLSPVQLGGGRDASGNLTLTWVRRTRLGGEWRDLVDASLGEVSENYSVDICSDVTYATVVRTLTSTTPTVDYSAFDQATDFGSAQAMVYAVVYQISASMSRGAPLEGVI